ncbi:MAG: hypothetical protein DI537_53975, partial [Stutzerimonas stutzeri]
MLHTIEGGFAIYREVADWCLSAGISGTFVVRMLDRSLEGDESLSPIYIRYISFEDAATGVIQHTINEHQQTRIIGPTLIDITGEMALGRAGPSLVED